MKKVLVFILLLLSFILVGCNSSNLEEKHCLVSFISNCDIQVENQKVLIGRTVEKPDELYKEGYTFDGWYVDGEKWSFVGYVVTKDLTLTARWSANTYTITYDVNEGDALASNTLRVTYDQSYTLAEPTRTGYTFDGWYDGETKIENGVWTRTTDLSVQAHWQVNTYTITYNVNGGDVLPTNTQYVVYGTAYNLVIPERTGYGFLGWYEGESKVENGTWIIERGITLQAHWLANAYTITYDVNGGDALAENTQAVSYDATFTLITPTRKGYTFLGWYNGETKVESGSWTNTEDITLKASWEANDYTITYNVNGGDALSETTQKVTYDVAFTLAVPTKTGYSFTGWYDGETKIENGVWSIASDVKLSAHWDAKTYTITYDVNGGDALLETTQIVAYDATYTLAVPTKTGYTFTGWYDGETKIENGVWTRTTGLSVQAHWQVNTYTITYDVNGGDALLETTQVVTYDAEYTLATPTRTGYTFAGWYDGEALVENGTWTIADNVTLQAHWKANTYTITYDVNGGDALLETTQTVAYDAEYTLAVPTRTGYTFQGWYDGETKIENGVWTRTTGLSVQAHWEANTYTITYDVNGGDALVENTQVVTYDAAFTLAVPTRTGCTFQGWYKGEKLIGEGTWEITSDVTLTAHWEVNVYTITASNMGGYEIVIMNAESALCDIDPFLESYTKPDKYYKQQAWRDVEEKYNCKITVTAYPAEAPWGNPRINWINNNALANQSQCDIAIVSSNWIPGFAQKGSAIDVSNYYDLYGYGIMDYYKDLGSYGDSLFIAPNYTNDSLVDLGLYYNYGLVKRLGLDDPATLFNEGNWNYTGFETWVRQAQAKMSVGKYALGGHPYYYYYGMTNAAGVQIADVILSETNIQSVASKNAMNLMAKLVEDKCMSKNYTWAEAPTVDGTDFFDEGVLMTTGYLWFAHYSGRWAPQNGLRWEGDPEFGYVPFPYPDDVAKEDTRIGVSGLNVYMFVAGRNYPSGVSVEDIYKVMAELSLRVKQYQKNDDTYSAYETMYSSLAERLDNPASIEAMLYYDESKIFYDPAHAMYSSTSGTRLRKPSIDVFNGADFDEKFGAVVAAFDEDFKKFLVK